MADEISHGELVQRIADAYERLDGKDMERLWNEMFPDQVKYIGDSMYEWLPK